MVQGSIPNAVDIVSVVHAYKQLHPTVQINGANKTGKEINLHRM